MTQGEVMIAVIGLILVIGWIIGREQKRQLSKAVSQRYEMAGKE